MSPPRPEESSRPGSLAALARRGARRTGPVQVHGLRGSSPAALGAELVRAHPERPALFLAADAKRADALLEDLRIALGEPPAAEGGRVRAFPRHDTSPYDRFSPQPFVVAQRMDVLYRWLRHLELGEAAPVVVTPWTALSLRVPSREVVRHHALRIATGELHDRDELVGRLVAAGYARQAMVEERGEIAVRGGIVDLFPPQRARPVRVELLGDEVESLREFDAASQRSQARLEWVVAPPPRELLCDRDRVIECSDALRALAASQELDAGRLDQLLDALLRGHLPPGAEALAPLLQPGLERVFDFLPDDALWVPVEPEAGRERLRRYADEIVENHAAALEAGRLVSPPSELHVPVKEVESEVLRRRPLGLEALGLAEPEGAERIALRSRGHDELCATLRRHRTHERPLEPLVDQLSAWLSDGWRVVLATPALSGAERLKKLLAKYQLEARLDRNPAPIWRWSKPGRLEIRLAGLSAGFALPDEPLAVVTEEEIFGRRERRRRGAGLREGAAVEALAQLAPGDHLVHAEHGIGIYRGLVLLELGGVRNELLRLEYEGGDRLFLPVHRLNLVQRYVGAEGQSVRVDRLGGATWEKAKQSVRKSVRRLARELLSVHAARELVPGVAYAGRDEGFEEFEAAFPFEETPDQAAAVEDVLEDLQRARPMDRLVCGDVGYGKTEVAVRAAFRVVMDGRQAAVLVPTTVLCQQHEESFRKRFAGYPVRIESLSRFRSPKQARQVREGLAAGKVDIVIGTHRLLQKGIEYRDLGLLVVDEEHRFGVAHKERIKQLKKTVDVLTLTATPIPRTLQMAFTGLRDLSLIHTPPADRLAVRTQVCRFDESLVREAILREVRRGGQVFFVHNRVQSIDAVARLLERIVPEVKILLAHGQMRERELEDRMLAFLGGEADLLLCTTIIESGLDIPRANTILIHRADTLGLAQLYQLRGRVGRSSHRAYAYLLVDSDEGLTDDARRRLEAIQDLSELGSGFRLANMDLEIRGAGNLLGGEQSGNLGAVGYETYMELLEETVEALRGRVREAEIDPEVRVPVSAQLPEAYVPEVSQRLVLYKRLAGARDDEELEQVGDELLDRYGPLPEEAEQLIRVIRLKIAARRAGITAVEWSRGEWVFASGAPERLDPKRLVDLLQQPDSGVSMGSDQRIRLRLGDVEPAAALEAGRALLEELRAARSDPTPALP